MRVSIALLLSKSRLYARNAGFCRSKGWVTEAMLHRKDAVTFAEMAATMSALHIKEAARGARAGEIGNLSVLTKKDKSLVRKVASQLIKTKAVCA